MDQKTIQQLEKLLKDKKAEIEKELSTFAKKDPKFKGDYDTRFPDFGLAQSVDENALEVAAYESALPIEYALELKLQDTNQALEKIKKGRYGFCQKCKKEIDIKRLKIFPEAKTCTKCG